MPQQEHIGLQVSWASMRGMIIAYQKKFSKLFSIWLTEALRRWCHGAAYSRHRPIEEPF